LRHAGLTVALALAAGAGIDPVNTLPSRNGLSRAQRLTVTAGGAELANDLQGHFTSPDLFSIKPKIALKHQDRVSPKRM
jgi:hypothetical protein